MSDNRLNPLFSVFPRTDKIVDSEGSLSANWSLSLHALSRTLQSTITPEGLQIPRLSADEINSIQTLYNQKLGTLPVAFPVGLTDISGTQIYDTTNHVPKIFIITYNGLNQVTFAGWKTYSIS